MEKINIAKILKDCPQGMELDCAMWDNVTLKGVNIGFTYPIEITYPVGEELFTAELTEYGCWSLAKTSKCVIFPKGKTTWEGFVPPCEFKDGDIIFTHADSLKMGLDNTWISIFKENSANGVITYAGIKEDGSSYYDNTDEEKGLLCSYNDIVSQSFATEEEKQKLFDTIKANGYEWNEGTKTLEKLIEPKPKFKVGDRIKYRSGEIVYRVVQITEDTYVLDNLCSIPISMENVYNLVPDKFDITTLKPYDKVLVRLTKDNAWNATFFSHYDKEVKWGCYPFVTTSSKSYSMCIPYEGNEHLLGKTDDCDNFYKIWE